MEAVDPFLAVKAAAIARGLEPKSPSEWGPFKFACPVVPEHGRSVVCTDGIDGRALVHCDKGCTPAVILDALGMTGRDVAPPRIVPPAPAPVITKTSKPDDRVAVWTKASDVVIKPVRFLWRPWLPLGKVTLLAGAPGQGKSQLTAMFAASVSRAAFFPGDIETPGTAVLMTAEDDVTDTVVPRLMAANADLARVEFVNMSRTLPGGITTDGLIKLPGDVETLHARLKHGDVRLVVLDPVASFVGREHSTYVNQDVRDTIDPLVALAARYDVAMVIVLHLNKSEAKTWALRIGESHAFQAIARTVLALAPDPDDEDGEAGNDKILAATKLNITHTGYAHAVKLRVQGRTVYDFKGAAIETSSIELTGASTIAADDLLADVTERGSRRDTLDFLVDVLAAGAMESKPLQRSAKDHGVSWRSVQRYYREVCKPAKPAMSRGPWVYELRAGLADVHTPGAHGEHDPDLTPSAPYTPGVSTATPDFEASENLSHEQNGGLGGQGAFDLIDYRRRRDAMLGERWDDE